MPDLTPEQRAEQIVEELFIGCSRCEGEGQLWADGKLHFATAKLPTAPCPNCCGTGEISPGRGDILAALRTVEVATIEKAEEWLEHHRDCIRSYCSAGEPTPDGGYRQKFNDVWYQAKPIDETPKCDCGLAEFIRRAAPGGTP